jgi:hypothetical protein
MGATRMVGIQLHFVRISTFIVTLFALTHFPVWAQNRLSGNVQTDQPAPVTDDDFRVCSSGQSTATGKCQQTPRGAIDALQKEVSSSIGAPQMGLDPGFPKSLQPWYNLRAQDSSAASYDPCANMLIQAASIIKQVAPLTRPTITPAAAQQISNGQAQATQLVEAATKCIAQANQKQVAPLCGQFQSSNPGGNCRRVASTFLPRRRVISGQRDRRDSSDGLPRRSVNRSRQRYGVLCGARLAL